MRRPVSSLLTLNYVPPVPCQVILQHQYWLPLYVSRVHVTAMCSWTVGLTPWMHEDMQLPFPGSLNDICTTTTVGMAWERGYCWPCLYLQRLQRGHLVAFNVSRPTWVVTCEKHSSLVLLYCTLVMIQTLIFQELSVNLMPVVPEELHFFTLLTLHSFKFTVVWFLWDSAQYSYMDSDLFIFDIICSAYHLKIFCRHLCTW